MSELSRRELLERAAYTAGLAGAASILPADLLLQEAARAQASALPAPQQHADRPLRHRDDGEPVVRPLLRLARRDRPRGRHASSRPTSTRTGNPVETRHASSMGAAEWQGCGHPDPGHGWGAGPRAAAGRLHGRRQRQRRVRAHLLQRGRARLHPRRRAARTRSTTAGSARSSARPGRTATTSGRGSPAARTTTRRPADTLGNQWETIFDVALAQRRDRALLQLGPAVLGDVRARAARRGRARSPSTTPTRPPARCRTSRSSTRRSATAAASTATRPTSIRTATCASGRRGWPTS